MLESEIIRFHDSFQRCMRPGSGFLDVFYDDFLASSEDVRQKFADTDFERQKSALRVSLLMVMNAAVHSTKDYSSLEKVAYRHSRTEDDVHPHLYILWLDSLVRAVQECDPHFTPEIGEVWRTAFQPALAYMISKY